MSRVGVKGGPGELERVEVFERVWHQDRLDLVARIASSIAHELGTPLNIIAGRASMIASGDLGKDEIENNARIIKQQVERMTKLLEQVLRFARPPKDSSSSPLPSTELGAAVARGLELIEPIASDAGIRFDLSPHEPVEVRVESVRVLQLVANLGINAIRSMKRGGTLRVSIRREHRVPPPRETGRCSEGEYAILELSDEGSGIDPERLPRLFEPWLANPLPPSPGLGLPTSYWAARDNRGWVEIKSAEGGTTVSVFLPVAYLTH
jgi:signal transduction histidine kinase